MPDKVEKPTSLFQVVKDNIPVLTPLAAVFVSAVAAYYTHQFNARTAANSASDTLGKLIAEAGQNSSDKQKRIEAMKIAAYGDQALTAVKMALAEDDLRDEGVLVAELMYRSEALDRAELTGEMLRYYSNPDLRLGAVQWLHKTGDALTEADAARAIAVLKVQFGPVGEKCADQEKQNKKVPVEVANFLVILPRADLPLNFVKGLATNCVADVKNQLESLLPKTEVKSP